MEIDHEKEKKDILHAYKDLVKSIKVKMDKEDKELVHKAFELDAE